MSIASKFPSTCEISSSSSTSCLYLEWYQPQHQSATRAPCPKKTVVIVPGFWVDPTSFDEVVHGLQGRGYRATTIRLPSRGCEPPTKTLVDDARAVHDEVDKLVQEGYDVTVVMHSAGGLIAPEGLQGLQAPDLAKAGGVTGLLYITASCMSVGEEAPPALWFLFEGDYLWAKDPRETLFNDLPAAEADMATKRLKHYPAHNYNAKLSQEPWKDVPSVCLECYKDATISLDLQSIFAAKIPGCDVEICNSGHSPFLSQPKKVVGAIIKAAEKPNKGSGL
ncbi:MAG: hypothetical protein ALECFALPRED_004095 [Alectoria fallacina]|uniref:AB hydrolase-1 domain-containing protein n=1 Tax=Alectoria fallacina TaxID=1903189 RepID=A0A8H3FSN0_9LECA|nr:MAG: hypothetical protein ALECFALPRED_004095 [Alectoria fallacina]